MKVGGPGPKQEPQKNVGPSIKREVLSLLEKTAETVSSPFKELSLFFPKNSASATPKFSATKGFAKPHKGDSKADHLADRVLKGHEHKSKR